MYAGDEVYDTAALEESADEPEGHDAHLYYAEPDEECPDCGEANQEMWHRLMASY